MTSRSRGFFACLAGGRGAALRDGNLVDSFLATSLQAGVLSVERGIPEHTGAQLRALCYTIEVVGACGQGGHAAGSGQWCRLGRCSRVFRVRLTKAISFA
jgi:hypothetical protein